MDKVGKLPRDFTVAKMSKYTDSGKTNKDMLKYGRNMAKVMNQRRSGRGK